jgi:hypothetical protein
MKYIYAILLSALTGTFSKAQMLAPEQLKADVTIVKIALEARHPEMYRYISSEKFNKLLSSIEDSLKRPLSVQDFYIAMYPLISSLKCGHTKWLLKDKDYYYPFHTVDLFPLKLYFVKDKAYVISHYSDVESPVLSEVISINGVSIQNLTSDLLDKLAFADGYSVEGKYYELNNFFPGIYSTIYGTYNQYAIEYLNKAQKPETRTYSGVSLNVIKAFEEKHSRPDLIPYSFSLVNNEIGWMDINRFFSYRGEPDFDKFLKKSFAELKHRNSKTLVIDLRGNEGGNEDWGIALYRYLAKSPFKYYESISVKKLVKGDFQEKLPFLFRLLRPFIDQDKKSFAFLGRKWLKIQNPKKDGFSGQVYLLLDGQSYSVTTEFASRAKSDGRAIIIGQESAGGYALNTSGFFSIVTLPNSKIELGIPLLGFNMGNSPSKNPMNRGVVPDYEIEISPEDIVNSHDVVKEFVLTQIKNTSK